MLCIAASCMSPCCRNSNVFDTLSNNKRSYHHRPTTKTELVETDVFQDTQRELYELYCTQAREYGATNKLIALKVLSLEIVTLYREISWWYGDRRL